MVDLDGAKHGSPVNFEAIREAAAIKGLFIEVGGGIRDMQRIEDYLNLGVKRVILGTAAVKNYPFVEEAVGFELDAGTTWSSFPKHTGYYHVKDISNASLTIKFIGTDLTLWTNLGRGSSMNYILDGGAEQTYDFTNNGPKPFLTGLESGEHTVVIKPTSLQSGADEFKLYAIFSRDASKQTVKGTAFEHIHFSIDGDWNKGDTEHYQICNCGEKFNLSEHAFTEWEISKEATADTQGTKKRECELCGKKETQKYSLNEQVNESQPTVESNSDVGGEPASFPVVPVAVGGGVLVVIIAVVVIILAKKKKK
jgi:hypothetical protein